MPPAARMGDLTAHGGTVVCGEPTVFIGSRLAARLGDPHLCPMSDGAKPHVGGVVISSSKTVWIGRALAARMGDRCGCPSAGTAGAGVPQVIGPGAAPRRASTDANSAEPDTGPHAEVEVTDWDHDGTLDGVQASARGGRMRNSGAVDIGPIELGVRHRMDQDYMEKTAQLSTDEKGGIGVQFKEETGHLKHGAGWSIGPDGEGGANPYLAVEAQYAVAKAESEVDVLVGSDGRRTGFGGIVKADASALSAAADSTISIPLPWGYSINLGGHVEGDVDSFGGGGGVLAFWDSHEERFHLRGLVALKAVLGFELGLNISVGRAYDSLDWAVVVRAATGGIPNPIVTGDATVLIG